MAITAAQWLRFSKVLVKTLADSKETNELLIGEEIVSRGRFERLAKEFAPLIARDPEAQALMRDKPRMARDVVDYDALRRLPADTVGGAYVRHLDRFGLDPDVLAQPAGSHSGWGYTDPDTAYLHERYRQVHDLWHALLGLGVEGYEEVLLHAFTWPQLRVPYSALVVSFGTLKHMILEPRWRMLTRGLREAWQAGRDAEQLLFVYWERRWDEPLAAARARYGIQELRHLAAV